jgi:hypothetical protein
MRESLLILFFRDFVNEPLFSVNISTGPGLLTFRVLRDTYVSKEYFMNT